MIVKVCGMKEAENIRQVEQTGADWMGFIDYEDSPRCVKGIPEYLPASVQKVGVFVNASSQRILEKITAWKLNLIQLHGNETPDFCRTLHQTGTGVIKVFSLRTPEDLQATESYTEYCDYFLFDTPCSTHGGSGKKFDWELLAHYHGKTPFLLSGGLNPDSLEALQKFSHPQWKGIDLNSGFERSPGIKDASLLFSFIHSFKQRQV